MTHARATPARSIKTFTLVAALTAFALATTACSAADVGSLAEETSDGADRAAGEIDRQLNESGTSSTSDGKTVTVDYVTDADTIKVDPPAAGGVEDVRLLYVDTPETSGEIQPYGPRASDFATRILEGEQVKLGYDTERQDPYGRALATVTLAGEDRTFNETLVERGYAQVAIFEPNDALAGQMYAAQNRARDAGAGIWSLPASRQCQLTNRGNDIGEGSSGC